MKKLFVLPIFLFLPFSLQAKEPQITTSQLTVIEQEGSIVSLAPQAKTKTQEKETSKKTIKRTFNQPSQPRKFFRPAKDEFYVLATAYSSSPDETDGSPFITASGVDLRTYGQRVVAANFLPFGTKIKLPDLYGDTIFEVQDRMHPRFSKRIDVWQFSKKQAKQFGIKWVRVKIIK